MLLLGLGLTLGSLVLLFHEASHAPEAYEEEDGLTIVGPEESGQITGIKIPGTSARVAREAAQLLRTKSTSTKALS
jgi:hypothetical protein